MSSFERLAGSAPINKAAMGVTLPGNHFSFRSSLINCVHSDTPLPITKRKIPQGYEDLTGFKLGRLTVIGLADLPPKYRYENGRRIEHKIRWVVRCACSYYEHRSSSALINLHTKPADEWMCSACKKMECRKQGRGPWQKEGWKPSEEVALLTMPTVRRREISLPIKKVPIPPEIRWAVWERDNFTCKHCGSRKNLSVDHIVAESKGGAMTLDNLQTLCRSCNSSKGDR